jgi:hypothetical protein
MTVHDALPSGAVVLLARWYLDSVTAPTRPDEASAVARLRAGQVARLSPNEGRALMRLIQEDIQGGYRHQKGIPAWFH